MKVAKKASVKAQAFCSKLEGKEVPKSTTWEQCTDIIYKHFEYSYEMGSHCKRNGDNTVISIYKGGDTQPAEMIEEFSLPNSEIFYESEGDWDWPHVYKIVVECIMKNWKRLQKGTKKKIKKRAPVDVAALNVEVGQLRDAIKKATGSEKKHLIKEYNEKSKVLMAESEKNEAAMKAKQDAQKASVEELNELRRRKSNLATKIRTWQSKGKDTTELSRELAELTKKLAAAKTGIKA